MKKIIYSFMTISILFLLACERELEYTSDFNFEVREIADDSIFINTVKPFSLEVIDIKNAEHNKDYKFSYEVMAGGQLTVKEGTTTLIEGNQYSYTVDSDNKLHFDLIPQSDGVIRVQFNLYDDNNVVKSKEVLVYCTDEDFSFTFTGVVPNQNGSVNSNIPFSLNITNTGLSANSFQMKYTSTGTGNVIIGGNIKPVNTYFNVSAGVIGGFYTSNDIGLQTVTFTVIDLDGNQVSVPLDFNFTAVPFSLAKISDFSVKNTLKSDFKFTLTNTLPTATYQIKFTSVNTSKIFLGTTQVPMNSWQNLNLSGNNLYTYKYEAVSNTNDVLTVEVKDSYGQIQSIIYNVTVFSKPVINNHNVVFQRTTNCSSTYCSSNGNTTSTLVNTITGGATLVKTKIIIRNKLTGAYDTIEFNNSNSVNTLEANVIGSCFTSSSSCNQASAMQQCFSRSKYAGQQYTVQTQDSDGVWSDISSGTALVQ